MLIPAQFQRTGFLDLIADAAFQLRLAKLAGSNYAVNRHARASILASAFSVECCANCLLADLKLSAKTQGDLERLTTLAKYEFYILASKKGSRFDRGRNEVGQITALIGIRNGFVHPKVGATEAEIGEPTEHEGAYAMELRLSPKRDCLGIPDPPLFWNASNAEAAFRAALGLFRYVLIELLSADCAEVQRLVCDKTEAKLGGHQLLMESSFDEYSDEFDQAAKAGFDLSFLGYGRPGST